MDVSSRVHAVVTGAGKGIGLATAERLLAEEVCVSMLDRDEAGSTRFRTPNAAFLACDVSRADQVAAAMQRAEERYGPIEILVNNAGIQHYGTVLTTTEDEWDEVLAVNLKSAFLCAKFAIPSMLKRGRGVVINVASVQSFHSQANVAPYTTSKTAMLGLTRSIAVDFAPKIRAVAVCPGTVDTPMVQGTAELTGDPEALYEEVAAMHLLKRIASPEEIAGLIVYLCSPSASFITGQAIRIDGGLGIELGGTVNAH